MTFSADDLDESNARQIEKATASKVADLRRHDAEVKVNLLTGMAKQLREDWAPEACPWVGYLDDIAKQIRERAGISHSWVYDGSSVTFTGDESSDA